MMGFDAGSGRLLPYSDAVLFLKVMGKEFPDGACGYDDPWDGCAQDDGDMVVGWHRAVDNSMSGLEFEKFCSDLLCALGFWRADTTPGSYDGGIDILAEKDGLRYGIQCKRRSGPVGPDIIREAAGSRDVYGSAGIVLDRIAVMSNSRFTREAERAAAALDVELWDGDWIESRSEELGVLLL